MQTQEKKVSQNSIQVIQPYWYNGTWVFDDPEKDLDKEPFVGGADTIITGLVLAAGIAHPETGFKMIFSAGEFPGHQVVGDWVAEGDGGNWYKIRGTEQEGWLCPALFKYFKEAPKTIYVKVETLEDCPSAG